MVTARFNELSGRRQLQACLRDDGHIEDEHEEEGVEANSVHTKMKAKSYPSGRNPRARPAIGFGEEDGSGVVSRFPRAKRRGECKEFQEEGMVSARRKTMA